MLRQPAVDPKIGERGSTGERTLVFNEI